MSGRLAGLGSLLGTGLRGLRSRLLLTVGSVLLAAIAVAAAVVGPMYQAGAAASFLVTKLQAQPPLLTGVVFDYHPLPDESSTEATASARRAAATQLGDTFGPATAELWSRRFTGFPGYRGEAGLVSAGGACTHVELRGRCPTKTGEALVLAHDSSYAPLPVGSTIHLDGVATPITIVGTYAPRPADQEFWFNLHDLESIPPQPVGQGLSPYHPAPLIVAPETFSRLRYGSWYVRAARRLVVTPQTTVADLQHATASVVALHERERRQSAATPPGSLSSEIGNALVAVSHQIQQRRASARSTVSPAVVSVILVALVLLLRLLSAAMDLRRTELALASLRGYSRRQMWLLGLVEPALMLVIATPLGVAAGYGCARVLARQWLVPGLPMPFGLASLLALLAVVAVTAGVAALVVREALSEPLSAQIAGVRRPGRSGRWGLVLRLALIAAAVAVLGATLASSTRSSPDATDLALPILLAVAAGLVTTLAAQSLARSWAGWTAGRRGVFAYVASRTISRRREGTLVILPLTAALAVSVFASGVFSSAADWRASDAATQVGADLSYSTKLTMDQAVALTHRIDPTGRWLMAIGAEYTGTGQTLIADTPRLARVAAWPTSWTPGMSAAQVQDALAVQRPSVILRGTHLSVTVDNQVHGDSRDLALTFGVLTDQGATVSVIVGPFRPGVSTASATLRDCARGCVVKQLSFGGPGGLTEAMHGSATLRSVTVDGRPVPVATHGGWHVATPVLNTPTGIPGQPAVSGSGVVVHFDARSQAFFAAITPDDVPRVRPVLVGRTAKPSVHGRTGGDLLLHTGQYVPLVVHPVATAESMPVLGPAGLLIDYTMLTRDVPVNDAATFVTILARSDTPAAVLAALGDQGIAQPTSLATTRGVLDQDAFALALNLYLVVTVIVVLLALAGLGANLAVQMPARRRDAASLRVVGLRRRSILAAVIAEFVAVLGAAALAGVLAGALSQYVVVRTVTLGYADTEHTPRLLPSFDLTSMVTLLVGVSLALLLVAVVVAGLTVRGARTASLRENAR